MAAVVFTTADRLAVAAYPSLARATAALEAGQEAATVLDAMGAEAEPPDGFAPGWYVTMDNRLVADPENAAQGLRRAARGGLAAAAAWTLGLNAIAPLWPAADVAKGHDWLAYGVQGFARVMLSTHWSAAQRLRWAAMVSTGAGDVSTPTEFFEGAHAAAAPVSPVVWGHPGTAALWNLGDAVANTASIVAPHWAALPPLSDLATGAWVNTIDG